MKKYIISFIGLALFCSFGITNAASIANNILIKGTVAEDISGSGYGGKLVFPNDNINGTKIITSSYNSVTQTGDFGITGGFWLQNLSSTTNPSYGWVTFDIGNVYFSGTSGPLVPKVTLKNIGTNKFRFEGYAWSNSSGWIFFGNTGVTNGSVIYDRTAGKINGCAWSQNVGWLCIDNIYLDTTPPDITTTAWQNFSKAVAANNSLALTTPELISKIDVENWNNTARTTYITSGNFNHDFRKAKNYSYVVTDETGNTSDVGIIKVVSNIPSTILSTANIGVTSASVFTKSTGSKIADGNNSHNINFTLRDTYGNLIVNEAGIKDVTVEIGFNNNVDIDQVTNLDLGNAIIYSNNPFYLVSGLVNNGSGYKSDANYNLDIKSYAPTKSGYTYTTNNNDISLSNLRVKVLPLMGKTGVGETLPTGIDYSSQYIGNFSFTPSVEITNLTNSKNFKLSRDIESKFTGTVNISKTSGSQNITNLKVHHKLDIVNSGVDRNYNLSFQDLVSTDGSQECVGYLRANSDNTSYISYNSSPDCIPNTASNIIINNIGVYSTSQTVLSGFNVTPKVVLPGLSNFDFKYSSVINYNIGSSIIKYPGLLRNYSNSLFNTQVKVSGITHGSDNNFGVTTEGNISYIGKLSKNDILTNIRKNVETYKLLGDGRSVNGVLYKSSDYNLNSWPTGIDTIIVDGADLFIGGDIYKVLGKVKSIVVLKKDDGTKGDIYIRNNVKFIGATLVTQKSIISGDGTTYYSDTGIANNQLFIKGSLISYNTIGGSSLAIPKCPYYIETCDYLVAKRYDLNNFRSYSVISGNSVDGPTYGVDMTISGYNSSSMIIEYDSEIQSKTPDIFLLK